MRRYQAALSRRLGLSNVRPNEATSRHSNHYRGIKPYVNEEFRLHDIGGQTFRAPNGQTWLGVHFCSPL